MEPITTIQEAKSYFIDEGDNPNYISFIEVSVESAFKALAKNGFDHIRDEWVSTNNDGTILGGCALGQMGVNLGAEFSGPCGLEGQLNRFDGAGGKIIQYNDWKAWNSAEEDYDYHDWKDVVAYAYEILKPHFKETLILVTHQFKLPENLNEQLTTPNE